MYGPQALEVADFSAEGKAECCLLVLLCVCAGVGGGDGGTSYPKNILQKLSMSRGMAE